jgi:mannose-1-phosphate guanylyltransferase/phosphomannomutase
MRTKARLTITLAKDLLRQIDQMVDRRVVRNRSHAIEMLIKQGLETKVTTAVILAGGQEASDPIPALLPVGDELLILITLGHLKRFGIRQIHLLAGANEASFKEVLGDGSVLGVAISYGGEYQPLGTAGAVKAFEERLRHEPFLVLHGDVLTDIDLGDFIAFHKNENRMATIAVKPRDAERQFGKVMLQGNRITHFLETERSEGISIINTGVYLLQPEVLHLIDSDKPSRFETDVFPTLAAMGELSAFFFQGIWFDVSRPESYQSAQVRWALH